MISRPGVDVGRCLSKHAAYMPFLLSFAMHLAAVIDFEPLGPSILKLWSEEQVSPDSDSGVDDSMLELESEA